MDLKRTNSAKKRLNQSHTSCSQPKKKSSSKQKKTKKTDNSITILQSYADHKKKKDGEKPKNQSIMNTASNKTVWFITGASSGFGKALATYAVEQGYQKRRIK